MVKVPCGYKKRGTHPTPVMGPYTPYKYYLKEPGFLADDLPSAAKPSTANAGEASGTAHDATDPSGASEAGADLPAASVDGPPAASTPAGKNTPLHLAHPRRLPFSVGRN